LNRIARMASMLRINLSMSSWASLNPCNLVQTNWWKLFITHEWVSKLSARVLSQPTFISKTQNCPLTGWPYPFAKRITSVYLKIVEKKLWVSAKANTHPQKMFCNSASDCHPSGCLIIFWTMTYWLHGIIKQSINFQDIHC